MKGINKIVHGISTVLDNYIKHDLEPGLYTGYSGAALFYAYYYKLTGKDKYIHSLNYIIEKTVKALSEKQLVFSHCSGISGILWCLQHLIKNNFIEHHDFENIFEEVDEVLFNVMDRELS